MICNISKLQDKRFVFDYMTQFHKDTTFCLLVQFLEKNTSVVDTEQYIKNKQIAHVLCSLDKTGAVEAIKKIRTITGAGLKDSKDFVDYFRTAKLKTFSNPDEQEQYVLRMIDDYPFRNNLTSRI